MPAESVVQKELGIKYVDARKLVHEAQASLGIQGAAGDREQEVIDEAIEIFEDLDAQEQDAMRVNSSGGDSEWKQKAKAAAERREKEWAEQAAMEERGRMMAQQAEADPVLPEASENDEGGGTTTVTTTVTKTTRVIESKGPLEMDGKCVCTLL